MMNLPQFSCDIIIKQYIIPHIKIISRALEFEGCNIGIIDII